MTTFLDFGSIPGPGGSDEGTIIDFPHLASAHLSQLLEAAAAPAQAHELSWEHGARTVFRSQAGRWTKTRHRRGRRAVVAAAVAAGVLAGSTGLAAATGFPAPAVRIVDHMFNDQPANVAPSRAVTPTAGPTASRPHRPVPPVPIVVSASPSTHRAVTPVCSHGATGAMSGGSSAPSCRNEAMTFRPSAKGASSPSRTGSGAPGPPGISTIGTSGEASVTGVTSPSTGTATQAPAPTSTSTTGPPNSTNTSPTSPAGNQGPGTGRGGNQGTGTGRGGNQGTGTGSGSGGKKGNGSGSGSGGKKGGGPGRHKGSGHGGNRGNGSGRGRTKAPATGTTTGGSSGGTTTSGVQRPMKGRDGPTPG